MPVTFRLLNEASPAPTPVTSRAANRPFSTPRLGHLSIQGNTIETPVFMPVATQGTFKSIPISVVDHIGYRLILANSYHLLLRPGSEVIRSFGGVKPWMGWPHSLLTDSGGFQVFSLAHQREVLDDGVVFQDYVSGQYIKLNPQVMTQWQAEIGSDITMAFDECVPSQSEPSRVHAAMERTHVWAKQCLDSKSDHQCVFGIVQGACDLNLREQSARTLTALDFPGYAIGGLAVGEDFARRLQTVAHTNRFLPAHKPRYFMGVGTPLDLIESVNVGCDMFDCILPESLARHGLAFTEHGPLRIRQGRFRLDPLPLSPQCPEPCCQVSRSYIHHLLKSGEMQGWSLLTQHNLRFYFDFMRRIRTAIAEGTFESFLKEQRGIWTTNTGAALSNSLTPSRYD